MAEITITIEDIDLSKNTFSTSFDAKDSLLDDGQATAAYFTGFFLHSLVSEPDFAKGVTDYGHILFEAMQESGPLPMADTGAKMTLTLTDENLETGQYMTRLTGSRDENDMGEYLPSTAEVVGSYMTALLYKTEFRDRVWEFAEELVQKNKSAVIANSDNRPDKPASLAA